MQRLLRPALSPYQALRALISNAVLCGWFATFTSACTKHINCATFISACTKHSNCATFISACTKHSNYAMFACTKHSNWSDQARASVHHTSRLFLRCLSGAAAAPGARPAPSEAKLLIHILHFAAAAGASVCASSHLEYEIVIMRAEACGPGVVVQASGAQAGAPGVVAQAAGRPWAGAQPAAAGCNCSGPQASRPAPAAMADSLKGRSWKHEYTRLHTKAGPVNTCIRRVSAHKMPSPVKEKKRKDYASQAQLHALRKGPLSSKLARASLRRFTGPA
eukprot:1162090-Pelagomonas_calceolata.AAC.1